MYEIKIFKWKTDTGNAGLGDMYYYLMEEAKKLGIEISVVASSNFTYRVEFESEEDMNLFKLFVNIIKTPWKHETVYEYNPKN